METPVTIYVLIDPITKRVKYVGRTTMTLKSRLNAHINEKRSYNGLKLYWIRRISNKGLIPIISQIEQCTIEKASECETKWIHHYEDSGEYLFNINY